MNLARKEFDNNIVKPIFILGFGAQKSATSWLHNILQSNNAVNFGFMKEYHIWDVIYSVSENIHENEYRKNEDVGSTLLRMMRKYEGVYESYFKSLIGDKVTITGDITPSYSTLSPQNIFDIKQRLEKFSFDVKAIYLIRDPVDRIWSALRMMSARQYNSDCINLNLNNFFPKYFKDESVYSRTEYNVTIDNIYSVFEPKNIYIGIYEELFTNNSINELSDFLSVKIKSNQLRQRVNASSKAVLYEENIRLCYNYYKNIYKYCNDKFPNTRHLWRSYND